MAISGGIKFFSKSKCLLVDEASCVASTGEVVEDYILDNNRISYWNSVESDDTITETLTVTFNSATIDRLFLVDHNFKEYTVKYWNGASYVNFTSVVGITGSLGGGISETTFSENTSYYEFASVTTTRVQVSVLKTQTANQEKTLNQIIVTEELGTLEGYPDVDKIKIDRNIVKTKMLSGKSRIVSGYESVSFSLKFAKYPSSLEDDLDLIFTLWDTFDPILVWLCGGRYGSTYFRYQVRTFRLQDVYQMKISNTMPVGYYKNIYRSQLEMDVQFEEHV